MLHSKVLKALNQQVNAEMFSAYLYLSMVAYFERNGFKGFAHWMQVQAKEEMEHAMKIFDFIHERGGEVTLLAIDKPKTNWKSPLAAFQDALKHEQKVTGLIHDLTDLAIKHKDHATQVFLQWFVTEQVEEEANAQDNVTKLEWAGSDKAALMYVDAKFGKRAGE